MQRGHRCLRVPLALKYWCVNSQPLWIFAADFAAREIHGKVDEPSHSLGGVNFPRFHQRACVLALIACVGEMFSVDASEHHVRILVNFAWSRAVGFCSR